jgi:ornithine cyclodeaminase/alanine dehydrogenase-like protein (mu-crystallin family)
MIVFSETGTPVAVLDATLMTKLRTAAASALASKYLSRQNSSNLLVMGTGALAPYMALAHCAVRPITRVSVWGRRPDRVAHTLNAIQGFCADAHVEPATAIESAVTAADIISCSTRSVTPILAGRWLSDGTFVDLVGSFTPNARESDDEVMRRARIVVDTRQGSLTEAGDIIDPLTRGVITRESIQGDLSELVRGCFPGRRDDLEITLFKSVGTAIEDVAVARLIIGAEIR